jgi:hypothetical protein
MQLYCIVAQNIADRHEKYFSTISALLRTGYRDNSWSDMLKSKLVSIATSVLTEYNIPEIVTEYFEWLGKSDRIHPLLRSIGDTFKDKHIVEITTVYKMRKTTDFKEKDIEPQLDGDAKRDVKTESRFDQDAHDTPTREERHIVNTPPSQLDQTSGSQQGGDNMVAECVLSEQTKTKLLQVGEIETETEIPEVAKIDHLRVY